MTRFRDFVENGFKHIFRSEHQATLRGYVRVCRSEAMCEIKRFQSKIRVYSERWARKCFRLQGDISVAFNGISKAFADRMSQETYASRKRQHFVNAR